MAVLPITQALESPTYQPAMRIVTGITNAVTPTVTTSFDHDYLVGLIVRMLVPREFGMVQLNSLVGEIVGVPTDDTFVIDINTLAFDTFINAISDPNDIPWYLNDYASVVPVGEDNSLLAQATRNVL